jgi:plastocyanin
VRLARGVAVLAVAGGASWAALSCGGGDSPTDNGPPLPAECSASSPPPNTVIARNFQFSPQTITVTSGTTVTWVHCGREDAHTVTANDNSFDSGLFSTAQKYARTFTAAGRVDYHCVPHPGMGGTVVVQ